MPNFIVPVVGNPNGGFENGDQVTAENLNAHVMSAVPTGDFIAGRNESTVTNLTDYYLKVESDGNIYKIASSKIGSNADDASHANLKVGQISSRTGDGVSIPYSSITLNNTSNFSLWLNAWSDTSNNSGGNFQVTSNSHLFTYNQTGVFGVSNNVFKIGTGDNRAWFDCNSYIWSVDSTNPPEFKGTHALRIPVGGNTQRPGVGTNPSAVVGQIRFNSDVNDVEFLGNNSAWYGVRNTASKAYPKFQRIYESANSVLTGGGSWGSRQYGSAFTIDCKQAEIFIPECAISTSNGDNDGWMYAKVELIARKETESNEYVIGQWSVNGNGSVAGGGRYIGGTWFLSPANVDLNGMNLYLRYSANSGWGGDAWYVLKFDSHLGYRPVIIDSDPITTGYEARLQVKVNNSEGSRNTIFGGGKGFWLKYPSASQY